MLNMEKNSDQLIENSTPKSGRNHLVSMGISGSSRGGNVVSNTGFRRLGNHFFRKERKGRSTRWERMTPPIIDPEKNAAPRRGMPKILPGKWSEESIEPYCAK